MVLPSLARLSIERAAPTAAPSDAPAPLATPSVGDVLERLARQEQVAGDAAHAALQKMVSWAVNGGDETVQDMNARLLIQNRKEAARAALDAFMDIGVRGVARALGTGRDDPREVDDAVVSLERILPMWDRYAIGPDRALLRDSFHASAQEKGLYAVLVDLLGRRLEGDDRLHDLCMLLVITMTGNLSGTFASAGSARAVDSNIHRLARTALAKASNGRIGSHLLASLANDMSTNLAEEYALTALLDLTYTPYMTPNRPPDDSAPEPMTSTAAALAADENIVILFQMFEGMHPDTHPPNIQNAALRVLSNVLYYNNGQTEPSPLLEQILKHDTVKTITGMLGPVAQGNTATWLQTDIALAFLERVLFALKGANEEVLDRAFEKFESHETAFVPTMLAYWKWLSLLTSAQDQQIGRIFSLFGQLDGRYEKESQKWQRALVTDQGVYDYLETTLKELGDNYKLNIQSATVYIDLLKYTLLPTPELWERAQTNGLLDWMIDVATLNLEYLAKQWEALHFVLSQIAAKNSGIAEWLLSNNREGTRRDRLLHCWAPKQYGSNVVAYGYASGFRALLCHGVAFDLVTTRNAQRVSGASVYTLPEGSEQWDWYAVEYILKDPNIIQLAAVQGPAPSTGAAILMTLHILDVLNEDPQATMFEGPEGEKPMNKLVRRNTKWAELLHQFQTLHVDNGQLAGQLEKLINLVTELLQNPGPSNSAYILSQRQSEVWEAQEVPEQPTKRPRATTTTDAVYARFLDLAQLRFPN